MRRTLLTPLAVVAAAVGLLQVPAVLSTFHTGLFTVGLIWGLLAMSLAILLTYGGRPSLGHAAFFGAGAYAVGIAATRYDVRHFFPALGLALVAALVVGLVFGTIVTRTRGIYSLLLTLALAEMLRSAAIKWREVTGGDDGLTGILRPQLDPLPWRIVRPDEFYYFVLAMFLICAGLIYLIVRSPFGATLVGIRESESRMAMLGYNTRIYQLVAFVLAGLFAGVAGVLDVYYNRFVGPSSLNPLTSAQALLFVILGSGTLLGPAIAAVAITFLEDIVSGFTDRWLTVLGIIYVAVSLVSPRTVVTSLRTTVRRSPRRTQTAQEAPEPVAEVRQEAPR